ncbi:TRAP transporter large permease [Microbaculum marinisediminis]|uniref:TRAP transporter large permease protein n=1 Tax=Microbaculum marinisediminis TaxID=2931392 RepID=A0AAW5QWV6_9HYPH|nr:TRAP transporter large permease [Microbaculum sp. A6E488]MCT8971384.1 TRAP transporter large permease [Microbaculum sp. A6E488]
MVLDYQLVLLVGASLVVILLGLPVAFSMLACSIVYLWMNDFPLSVTVQQLGYSLDKFTFLAVPLFMLAGLLMNAGKVTDRIFDFANALVGRVPGGLGHVNVVASLIFSGMSGSVLADVAGLGAMEVKAMRDKGYDTNYSVGITLASSAIGPMFPPSVSMVLFGVVANVSITGMFLGGVLPGILIALCLMVYIFAVAIRRNYYTSRWAGWPVLTLTFLGAVPALLTPVIVVGGMILGIFSPTEAATVAALYALFLSGLFYRELSFAALSTVLLETALSTAKLMFIIASALLFGWVLTIGELPQFLANTLQHLFPQQWAFVLAIIVVFLVLGAVMENAILLLVLAPMLLPIARDGYGMDPIHIGVVMVFANMIGQYTPPLGLSLFVMRDVTGLSLAQISRAVAPFLVPLVAALVLMAYIPQIVVWLPHRLGY